MRLPGVRRTGSPRLDAILASVTERLAGPRFSVPSERPVAPPFAQALRAPGLSVIAECKRRSPSAGALSEIVDVADLCAEYAEGGAAALSILTERDHFDGAPADLLAASAAGLPRLRKDFVVAPAMIEEAAALGASAVLLIAVCLEDGLLAELRAAAREHGLDVLLEVHDAPELERALAVEPECLGVNARDLRTFQTDLAVVEDLLPRVPEGYVRVAESGIRTEADAARVRAAGADAILVGEALVTSDGPAARIAAFRRAASEVPHGA